MNVLQKYEFANLNDLLKKVDNLIRENIESVKKSNLAYTTFKIQDKYILEILKLND